MGDQVRTLLHDETYFEDRRAWNVSGWLCPDTGP
ncbi:MAG: hypothetical protein RLZZ561_892 [Pseudomonadota bacterium]|jgi:hypothetical protein